MRLNWAWALIPAACLTLGGCDFGAKSKSKAPTGQVVATVDGDEITMRELRAELAGATFPDANARKAAEQAALQSIINRKLVAKAALEAELDKTPDFALQKERANELLLAQALQKKIVDEAPAPSREEATTYVNLRALEARVVVTQRNVTLQRQSLSIAQARFREGETSERDPAQAEGQLRETEAKIPTYEAQIEQARNALAVLLGITPAEIRGRLRPAPVPRLDLAALGTLEFQPPDRERFPCLDLAYQALREGRAWPIVLNAANEVAVEAFLAGRLSFGGIPRAIFRALEHADREAGVPATLADVRAADLWARSFTAETLSTLRSS